MKYYFLFVMALCLSGVTAAQSGIKPLEIGQEVPDINFNMIVDGKKKLGKLSDFKGRPLILDFWNVSCPTCIKQFSKYRDIQSQLGERAVIMLVGFDTNKPGSIEKFVFERKKNGNAVLLPTIVQSSLDSALIRLFPTRVMPHIIWIDKSGIFRGTTEYNAVTLDNILDFSGGSLTWEKRKNKYFVRPGDEFLIKRDIVPVFGSVFAGYIDTLGSTTQITLNKQYDSSMVRFYFHNNSVPYLYGQVYSAMTKKDFSFWNKRIITDDYVANKYKANPDPHSDNWQETKFRKENMFSYELILPTSFTLDEAYRYMIVDLDRYFGIRSVVQDKKLQCYALVRTSKEDKLRSKKQDRFVSFDDKFEVTNVPFRTFFRRLESWITDKIIFDDTGYAESVDITLDNIKQDDIESLNKALSKYDLCLVETERNVNCLLLTFPY